MDDLVGGDGDEVGGRFGRILDICDEMEVGLFVEIGGECVKSLGEFEMFE